MQRKQHIILAVSLLIALGFILQILAPLLD